MSERREAPPSDDREIAVLVAVHKPSAADEEIQESLDELEALSRTAGARVADSTVQKRTSYDPATLVGSGKVDELSETVEATGADLVIFDNELTVTQQDRLESALGARVIDRTALILDIFALHAHTKEGRTQVELAQLNYLLPRIRGRGPELSRLGGGIGTRGPGETKLEVDRRRIRRRIRKLNADLSQMESVRATQRKQRTRAGLPSVCLIGYTNSGKSSLLNRLTGASVLVEDQLFSTLDSTTRRLKLPEGRNVVISDTVGFIRKLPHELIAAFRSTLEVVREADLLIHVVDATGEDTLEDRLEAVREALEDLESAQIRTMTLFNKADLLEAGQRMLLERRFSDSLHVSALTGEGTDELLSRISENLEAPESVIIEIPAGSGDIIASVYRDGVVTGRELVGETVFLTVSLPEDKLEKYRRYQSQKIPDTTS